MLRTTRNADGLTVETGAGTLFFDAGRGGQIGRFLKHRPVTFPILLDVDSTTFDTWQIQQ